MTYVNAYERIRIVIIVVLYIELFTAKARV